MRPTVLLLLALFPFVGVARTALADDDANTLLRQGMTAESVERDYDKALALYERVVQLVPSGDLGGEALWAIARVHEARGDVSAALQVLRRLTKQFGATMAEERKRHVHEAMVRLLPPGSEDVSPLGRIYVVSRGPIVSATDSPLEVKIRELFDQLDAADPQSRGAVQSNIRQRLEAVGDDALPVLEAIAREGSPDRSAFAAEQLARLGQEKAVAPLERLVSHGDAFTRQAAIDALRSLYRVPPETLVPMLDRLLAFDLSDTQAWSIRRALANELTPEQLLARHREDPEHAMYWLGRALDRKDPAAAQRAIEIVKAGGDDAKEALVMLAPLLVAEPGSQEALPPDVLGPDGAWGAFDLLLQQPIKSNGEVTSLLSLARLVETTGGAGAGAKARARLWARLPEVQGTGIQAYLMQRLAAALPGPAPSDLPPSQLLQDAAFRKAFFPALSRIASYPEGRALRAALLERGGLWPVVAQAMTELPQAEAFSLAWSFQNELGRVTDDGREGLPPREFDARWLEVLELPSFDPTVARGAVPYWMPFAAARTNDPRFLALVERNVLGRVSGYDRSWIRALAVYRGPGRLELVEKLLADPRFPGGAANDLLQAVASEKSNESHALLARMARAFDHPVSIAAVVQLGRAEASDEVLAIAAQVPHADVSDAYRKALITSLTTLHLKAAVPYLLYEYRRGPLADEAAGAMDAIRAYHQRLAEFADFAQDEGEANRPKAKTVEDLLGDADPAIRRAAVLALGALRRTEAVERLVRLAKDDPDEAVRQAALEAVERIATER